LAEEEAHVTIQRPNDVITISNVPRREFLAAKALLEETTGIKFRSNAEVVTVLIHIFQFWYENISTHDAYELREIVEKMAMIKKYDKQLFSVVKRWVNHKLNLVLEEFLEVGAGAAEIVSKMFRTNIFTSDEEGEE
jgi:hypothetical protein